MAQTPIPLTRERDTLTLSELADRLSIGKTRAYELAQKNDLPIPTLRIGREYRFSRRTLERWLESDQAADADNAA